MNDNSLPNAIFLMGPTASGKTDAAVTLAEQYPVELISVDSALVYQEMNIGTAKPDAQTLAQAPHYLIDIIPPTAAYSAASFRQDALVLMKEITAKGKIPVLVGGTMLYFKALEEGLSGLPQANQEIRSKLDDEAEAIGWPAMHRKLKEIDPSAAERIMPNDMQRIQRALEVYEVTGETMSALYAQQASEKLPYTVLKIALIPGDRKILHERIALRFKKMLNDGLVDEVKSIITKYPSLTVDSTAMRSVGYRQVLKYLAGEYDNGELCDRGVFATRQLAKRQLTWLRGMQDVVKVDSLLPNYIEEIKVHINQFIK
ncbi:MAG: tRNA (adenosine(37)-N6)-dimethylallyltransferase MiaA [Methylophilaceae bacterium]